MDLDLKLMKKKTIPKQCSLIQQEQNLSFILQIYQDINEENPPKINSGFAGVTLAYNVEFKEDVDKVIELARSAGATIAKEPQDVFWGGYHAYFADLDGYYWEVAWGPNFKYDENGLLILQN